MVAAILKSCCPQLEVDGVWHSMHPYAAGPVNDLDDQAWIAEQCEGAEGFWEDINHEWLEPGEVRKARTMDVEWFDFKRLFIKIPMSEVKGPLLTWKWVDTLKSDGRYRSRLVMR